MLDFREFWKNPSPKGSIGVFRASPYTSIAELEYIAELLLEWLDKEPSLLVSTFYSSRNIAPSTFYGWMNRCPQLKWAWEVALQRIGERRELGGLTNKLNAGIVQASQSIYSKEWADLETKRQERKAKNEEGARQTIVVVRDKMPDTPEVSPIRYEGTE